MRKSMLPKKNRLEEYLDVAKSIMKSLRLGYEKNDMCPTFCICITVNMQILPSRKPISMLGINPI
jgi:hypothetical protein